MRFIPEETQLMTEEIGLLLTLTIRWGDRVVIVLSTGNIPAHNTVDVSFRLIKACTQIKSLHPLLSSDIVSMFADKPIKIGGYIMAKYIVKIENEKGNIYLLSRLKDPRTDTEVIGFGIWDGNPYDLVYFPTEDEAQSCCLDLARKGKPRGVPVILKVLDI